MVCNEAGEPTKPKMSILTVASDKSRGIIGKAELNLAQFNYDDYRVIRLPVEDCRYEGAWIEIGLKATPASRNGASSQLNTSRLSLNSSQRSNTTVGSSHTASYATPELDMTEVQY